MSHDVFLFFTLAFLEIVLGVDNVVFLSLLANSLPEKSRGLARGMGLSLALILRVVFLLMAAHLTQLKVPIFFSFSTRDLVLFGGGGYLLIRSIDEIRKEIWGQANSKSGKKRTGRRRDMSRPAKINTNAGGGGRASLLLSTTIQIGAIDLVFSIDTIMTAIGMTKKTHIITAAIGVAIVFMFFFSHTISYFLDTNPRLRRLALCFLGVVGCTLVLKGFDIDFDKNYLLAVVGFALFVEGVNMAAGSPKRT